MKNGVIKFCLKALLLGAPVLLLFVYYIVKDPFRVLYNYDQYYEKNNSQYVYFNKDMITTETFIKQYPEFKYDSYIFGNSRSYFYRVSDWQPYIDSGIIYHFNANDESLYGIYKKVQYLDENNCNLKNALFIIDSHLLSLDKPNEGHIFIKHRIYTGQSWFSYQAEFLSAFYNPVFLLAYLDLQINGKFKSYMKSVMSDKMYRWDAVHNEMFLDDEEVKIKSDSIAYYQSKKKIFYSRPAEEKTSKAALTITGKEMLVEIRNILSKHKTNYRIIVSPLYDQLKLNPADLKQLQDLFGKEYIYDYSGKNRFTENPGNYYEISHYRPVVTKQLLKEVYTSN